MSRHMSTKSQTPLESQAKLRCSQSPKNRPPRLGSRGMTKSSTYNIMFYNSKNNESNVSKSRTAKSRKDVLMDNLSPERLDPTQYSNLERKSRDKSHKSSNSICAFFGTNAKSQKSQNKGELIKKLVLKKDSKTNSRKDSSAKESEAATDDMDLPNHLITATLDYEKNLQKAELMNKKDGKYSVSMASPEHYRSLLQPSEMRFQSVANISKNASSYMFSRNGSQKFNDLEMEIELADKNNGMNKLDSKKSCSQNDKLSSHAYELFKQQRTQERAKIDSNDNNPRVSDAIQRLTPVYSPERFNKVSPRRHNINTFADPLNNTKKAGPRKDNNAQVNRYKAQKKRAQDLALSYKNRNHSATGDRSREMMRSKIQSMKISHSQHFGLDNMSHNEVPRNILAEHKDHKDHSCDPPGLSGVKKRRKQSSASPENKNLDILQRDRLSTDPRVHIIAETNKIHLMVNDNSQDGLINLDAMNINQLIQLKNIIDEKIEVEHLRNKRDHIRTSPMMLDQKSKKPSKSQGDEKFSRKRSFAEELKGRDGNNEINDPTSDFRKMSSFLDRTAWRRKQSEERGNAIVRHGTSSNYSSLHEYDMNAECELNAIRRNPPTYNSVNGTVEAKLGEEQSINSKSEAEQIYNQKLQEFLEARKRMLDMEEDSDKSSDTEKKAIESYIHNKNQKGLVQLNDLLRVNSPEYQARKQNEKDLVLRSSLSPKVVVQAFRQNSLSTCTEDVGTDQESVKLGEDLSSDRQELRPKLKDNASKEVDFSSLKVQAKNDLQKNDLMGTVNKNDQRERKIGRLRNRSSGVESRLSKNDFENILRRANELEDTPSASANGSTDSCRRRETFLKYKWGFTRDSTEHKTLMKILNNQLSDKDDTYRDILTHNANLDSKSTSSIVETDLSVLAINKQVNAMRSEIV